jgi:hypothetical protein
MPPGAKNSWRVGRRVEVSVEAIGGGAFLIIGPSQTAGDQVGFCYAPHFDNIHELRPAFRIER